MDIIALGADHAGFELKETVKKILTRAGVRVEDFGCAAKDSVDYPDYAFFVAQAVAQGQAKAGVLICNTGIGMTITANKVAGVRAALVSDAHTAQMSREHNDANILVLGARTTDVELAEQIIKIWFFAAFQGGRHARRVDKIREIENGIKASS